MGRRLKILDLLAASGIRGLRFATEVDGLGKVYLNDKSEVAYKFMRENLEGNKSKLKCEVKIFNEEANELLFSLDEYFDYIDVDPYGSPIPFIDSAVKPLAKKGFLGVTATDAAPLVCSHSHKTLRRYNVLCRKTDFEKELGLRILIYNIVFRSASHDVALTPVLSYSHQYYYRVFFVTERSGQRSYEVIKKCRGYIWYCK